MKTKGYTSFDDLPDSYADFLDEIERKNYFYGGGWFRNFSDTALEPEARLRLYAVEDDLPNPKPRVLLITRTPAGQNGSILRSQFLGRRTLASMTNHQSVFFSPLVSEDDVDIQESLQALVEGMCSEVPPWTLIDLNLLDCESPVFAVLVNAFRAAGMVVQTYRYHANLYERIDNRSFSEYLSERPSVVRKTYLRSARQLEKMGQVQFRMIRDESEVESGILDYERVLRACWKEPEPYPEHTAGLIRASASAGTLRLGFLYFNGVPVATQLWILSGGSATIYKLHYDQSFRQYSVGSVLTLRMFEYVIEVDGAREINFGVGDEPHKQIWLSEVRDLQGILVFNPRTIQGNITLGRHFIGKGLGLARHWAKPILKSPLETLKRLTHKQGI